MDRVLRVCDIKFFIDDTRTTDYAAADEVRVVFGKQKMLKGGKVRCNNAAL